MCNSFRLLKWQRSVFYPSGTSWPSGGQRTTGNSWTNGELFSPRAPIICAHTWTTCRNLLAKRSAGQELRYLFYLTMIVIEYVPRFPQDDNQTDGANAFLFRFSGLTRQTWFARISRPSWRDGKFYFDFCNSVLEWLIELTKFWRSEEWAEIVPIRPWKARTSKEFDDGHNL